MPHREENVIIEPQRRKGAKKSIDVFCSYNLSHKHCINCIRFKNAELRNTFKTLFFAPLRLCGSTLLGVIGAGAVQTLMPFDHDRGTSHV